MIRHSIAIAVLLLVSMPAPAQVVSPAGTMDVMVSVQHTHIDAHTNSAGELNHNIDLRAISAVLSVEYSLTDRVGLSVSLPYIQSRYRGPSPHPDVIVDDGSIHGSLQDLQFDARYALIRGEFAVSPFVGYRHPTREYATMGHASPGRGLKELEIGVSAGRRVPAFANTFVGANIAYAIPEAVAGIRVTRTNADLQVGYALGERLFARAFGAWQRSHDGIDVPVPLTSEYFHHHDQLARANHIRLGAGLVFALRDNMNLHAAYSSVVRSSNAHMGRSVSIGTSWTFAPRARAQK